MLIHLLATFSAGICAAGVILLFYRVRGRKSPRYLAPLAAGLAMIAYNLWDEYSWAPRTIASLPEQIEVVETFGTSAFWKPWTYLVPQVDRFSSIDRSKLRRNQELPGYVLAEVILVARRGPTVVTQQLFDCPNAKRTDVIPSRGFDENGLPRDQDWMSIDVGSPLFKAICPQLPAE